MHIMIVFDLGYHEKCGVFVLSLNLHSHKLSLQRCDEVLDRLD